MYKNTKYTIVFPLILAAGIVLGVMLGQFVGRNRAESQIRTMVNKSNLHLNNKILQTCMLVEHQFVDSISMDSLSELVIPLMMKELDPHSVYIPAREMQEMNEPLEGEFDGIGVMFNAATDTVIVLNVIPNGPSAKAGVVAGDRIIKINDTIAAGVKMPQAEIMKRLRGRRGTEVKLSLKRLGIEDLVDIVVVRDVIPIKSIESAFMVDDKTGFVKLSQFARTSYQELMLAMLKLRAQGMRNLIVYTEDRNGEQMKQFSNGKGISTDLNLVVLIDEESASSSEILAGAVQDNDRGTIIGRRSFGKGLVQSQLPYKDGSALRLTIARYYTPTGRSIQKPYKNGEELDYQMDIVRRYNNNEFFSADSIHFADSLKFTTPKGKIVYGGGGIMPDVFVPLDTTHLSRYYMEVSGRNILYRYTIDYADKHRAALNKVQTLEQLDSLLDADKNLFNDFVRHAAQKGVKPNRADIAKSREVMEAQLRAYIGRNTVLEDDAFYHSIFPIDNVLISAMKWLEQNEKAEAEQKAEQDADKSQMAELQSENKE